MTKPTVDLSLMTARIAERLEHMRITERQASLEATGKPYTLRYIRDRRSMPSADRLERIAEVLGTTTGYLTGRVDEPLAGTSLQLSNASLRLDPTVRDADERTPVVASEVYMPRDVPIFECSVVYDEDDQTDDGSYHEDQIHIDNRTQIGFFRRIPTLIGVDKLYGLFMPSTSMGQALSYGTPLLVDPTRPASYGDFVVATICDNPDDDYARLWVTIKQLLARDHATVTLRQFEPGFISEIPLKRFKSIHRIMTMKDVLLG